MNIYLISQDVNTGYDLYDSAVVVAEDEYDATTIHPGGRLYDGHFTGAWVAEDQVEVKYLGIADKALERGVVYASFNGG